MTPKSDWITHLEHRARAIGWSPEQIRILRAFDRDDADRGVRTFEQAVRELTEPVDVVHLLVPEVDTAQAEMFARRLDAVVALCRTLGADGELLHAFLGGRLHEILGAAPPRALRVRAVADYVYSQAARFLHTGEARSYTEHLAAAHWTRVAEGVRHTRLTGPGPVGPLFVNLLEVRDRRLKVLDTRPDGDLVDICRRHGAVAGLSGGFFLYSEPDLGRLGDRTDPVGLLVSDGVVSNPPVFPRGALLQTPDGEVTLERYGLDAGVLTIGGVPVRPEHITTRARASQADLPGLQIVGLTIVGRGTEVPVGGLHVTGDYAGPVVFTPRRPLRDAIAGGPILLAPEGPVRELTIEGFTGDAPPITFSQDETYDENLLPRMGVGRRDDGSLVFAAVDGRNPYHAPGTTLRGLAELLASLGATTALNLDGGSSKRMCIAGALVDRSSTEVGGSGRPEHVRPVHSAILVT